MVKKKNPTKIKRPNRLFILIIPIVIIGAIGALLISSSFAIVAPEPYSPPTTAPTNNYKHVRVNKSGVTVTSGGFVTNARTLEMLKISKNIFSLKYKQTKPVYIKQGSYCAGKCESTSGNTHDGGGALDIFVKGYTQQERNYLVKSMREAGFAAWLRLAADFNGDDVDHIHAVAIGDKDLAPFAKTQACVYAKGKLGLSKTYPHKDRTPGVPYTYPAWAKVYYNSTNWYKGYCDNYTGV